MRYLYLLCLLYSFCLTAQIDHWESVVLPGDQWDYLVPTSQPSSNWNQLGFNSSSWNTSSRVANFARLACSNQWHCRHRDIEDVQSCKWI